MTQSISLIQAIILLGKEERYKKPAQSVDRKIDRLELTSKNLALAKELTHRVLGRNLTTLPSKTKILFLLIEKMAENECKVRKIEHSAFRFTRECIRSNTGWSHSQLRLHLNRLESLQYLRSHRDKIKREFQYELRHSSKSVTTITFTPYG